MMATHGKPSKSIHPRDSSTRSQKHSTPNPLYGIEKSTTSNSSMYPTTERRRKTDQKYDTVPKHDDFTSKSKQFDTVRTDALVFSKRQEEANRTRPGVPNESDFSRSLYTKTMPEKEESLDPRSNVRKVLDLVFSIRDVDLEKALQEYRVMKEFSDPSGLTKEDEYHQTTVEIGTASRKYHTIPGTSRVEAERDALKVEVEELHKKIIEMDAKFEEELITRSRERESENEEKQNLKKQIEDAKERKIATLEEWKNILEDYDLREMSLKSELDALKIQTDKLNYKIRSLEKERDTAQREKTEALTRLSKEMGSKLSEKNPNIADLSDKNRPTRLAEKYNELYDNEWTDAIEILSSIEEESAIKILLNIIQTAYQFCQKVASEQLQTLQNQISNPIVKRKEAWTSSSRTVDTSRISDDLVKILADCRKTIGTDCVDELYKEFLAWRSTGKHAMKVEDYSKKCLGLCWLMVIQDPPVVLGKPAMSRDKMDINLFREYTKTGSSVAYTVWLPLFLHQDGPLLSKGVAQPSPVKTHRRAKTAVDRKTRESTAAKLGNKSRNSATSRHQEGSDSGISSVDTQREVDDTFATGQRGLGNTYYSADLHFPQRPYNTERISQYANTSPKGQNFPKLHYNRDQQYVEYDGQFYTREEWDELQMRIITLSRSGQSNV